MDEQTIREAAVTALADLQLDCEVREVRRSGDDWCVQFSGEFGQFCDGFATQFGKDNSPGVMREKIKAHLLKQVSKIRSKTGKTRRARADQGGAEAEAGGNVFAAPLKVLGEIFDNVTRAAGPVMGQAANVAGLARDLTANMAEDASAGDDEPEVTPLPEAPYSPAPSELTTYAPKAAPKRAARSGAKKSAKKSGKSAAGGRKSAAKKSSKRPAAKAAAKKSSKAAKRKK